MAKIMPGERVRLKPDSFLCSRHPELAEAVGVVSSSTTRGREALLHVRFASTNVVALNVLETHFEPVARLEPRLRVVG